MHTGFRVYTRKLTLPQSLIGAYAQLPAANVADCMYRLCAMSPEIKLMTRPFSGSMAGSAVTVKARPGDNLMIHRALDTAEASDIIVVSNEGERTRALIGEIIVQYALHKKLGGFVLDGPIRDVETLYNLGLPIYATGSTPGGPFKDGPGEINVPIACGNIHVAPGDLILGDQDGVIVIPHSDAEELYKTAVEFSANDHAKAEAARTGKANRAWVQKALDEKQCEIIDSHYFEGR